MREGTVDFRGHRTWYGIAGEHPARAGRAPLLVVHGGPGMPHDYLEDLAALADDSRTVIFYDQLGCGRSDQPDDDGLWRLDTFVEELGALRAALGLDHVHLLGHSSGGWTALEYALAAPAGLVSLVLASTCSSLRELEIEAGRLKDTVTGSRLIDLHEADGTTDDPEYAAAYREFATTHLCRLDPMPEHVASSVAGLRREIHDTMVGVADWRVTGNLRGWDVTSRLGELDLPVLVTWGRFDAVPPVLGASLVHAIDGAVGVAFERSSHVPSAEEPERYRKVLSGFLDRADADSSQAMGSAARASTDAPS